MDSIAGDAAFLAGTEIVNVARTIAYLQNGVGPGGINVRGDCGCPGLIDIIGCDDAYVDPATDNAPWYSEDHPESADFAGFYPTEFEGMSSPFERSTSQNVGDGGAFGRSRIGSRTLTWRGYLFGGNCCAVSYGLRWLAQILRASSDCGGCQGQDLELLVCCPDVAEDDGVYGGYDLPYGLEEGVIGGIDAFRTLKNVALLEGPTILSERRSSSNCSGATGCGGAAIVEIEFSLFAAIPWFFRPEIPVANCISILENGVERITVEEPDCPPVDCGGDFFNVLMEARGCAVPTLPPAATYSIDCFNEPVNGLDSALYITVPKTWRDFEEAVPYIVIDSQSLYMTDIQLSFYTSASGDPCGDLSSNDPECDVTCDKLRILGIPANSKFIIDGRTRTMSVICNTNVAFPGERFTLGAFSWPVFSCYGFCLEIAYSISDPAIQVPFLGNGCVSVSMIPRTL